MHSCKLNQEICLGDQGSFQAIHNPHPHPILPRVLGSVEESSPVQLDWSISDVPLMSCLERVSEWLVPVYPGSTWAYVMFASELTRCFSQLERCYAEFRHLILTKVDQTCLRIGSTTHQIFYTFFFFFYIMSILLYYYFFYPVIYCIP